MTENLKFKSDTEIAKILGQRIKAARLNGAKPMTSEQLATAAGLSRQSLSTFENSGRGKISSLIAIMRALDLLGSLGEMVPDFSGPSPMELLHQPKSKKRVRSGTSKNE